MPNDSVITIIDDRFSQTLSQAHHHLLIKRRREMKGYQIIEELKIWVSLPFHSILGDHGTNCHAKWLDRKPQILFSIIRRSCHQFIPWDEFREIEPEAITR